MINLPRRERRRIRPTCRRKYLTACRTASSNFQYVWTLLKELRWNATVQKFQLLEYERRTSTYSGSKTQKILRASSLSLWICMNQLIKHNINTNICRNWERGIKVSIIKHSLNSVYRKRINTPSITKVVNPIQGIPFLPSLSFLPLYYPSLPPLPIFLSTEEKVQYIDLKIFGHKFKLTKVH